MNQTWFLLRRGRTGVTGVAEEMKWKIGAEIVKSRREIEPNQRVVTVALGHCPKSGGVTVLSL